MELGIDLSTYLEEEASEASYFEAGSKVEPLRVFRLNGVNYLRLRLWVDPFDENGKPYLGGTNDLKSFLTIAKLGVEKGYRIILDFHYSDFWVDPGKQTMPKAWQGLGYEALKDKVAEYTLETLKVSRENDIDLSYIQLGNEITNWMLWPLGKLTDNGKGKERGNYETLIGLLKEASRSCRLAYPKAKLIVHLERSGDNAVYREFFNKLKDGKLDYDVIGMSYYPYWHGTFDQFFANVDDMKRTFGKEVAVMEFGYAYTMEDYIKTSNGQLVVSKDSASKFYLPYPLTTEGQEECVERFLALASKHGISLVCYWEPCWIPGNNTCWASKEGQAYIGELGKEIRNEWANQCLFDYGGNVLPAFYKFRKMEGK